jgi:hypothetical protein
MFMGTMLGDSGRSFKYFAHQDCTSELHSLQRKSPPDILVLWLAEEGMWEIQNLEYF